VGAWLRAIVRNNCRMRLRAARPQVPLDFDLPGPDTVVDALDRQAVSDWVWHAVGQLSEPLQLAVMLRHFGPRRSYAEIATICGVPVGTVRSRLSEGRRQLLDRLLAHESAARPDSRTLVRERREGLSSVLELAEQARPVARAVTELTHADLVLAGWWGTMPRARPLLRYILRSDAEAGVRERIVDVVASTRFTVMECELASPPWDPTHCPPSVLWVVRMREQRVDAIRLYHPVPA
jgi:RNA polymerase sigma-70 factor (ECF subfamily)